MFRFRLLAVLALFTMNLMAWDDCCCNCPSHRMYVGGFGGGLFSESTKMSQEGTAFFLEAQGGALAVLAEGKAKRRSTGFGGVQFGYEWLPSLNNCECSSWTLAPAAEFEAFFYSNKRRGLLINPTERLDAHDFVVSFNMHSTVLLANVVFSLDNPSWCGFTPYVGGGIGAGRISIRNAKSIQADPPEVGVNHFNSKRSDSSWAFAAQAKAGLRYNITGSFHIFGEYRYLYIDSSNYILGSTVFPGYAVTSPWNFKVKNIQYNAFVVGIQYDL